MPSFAVPIGDHFRSGIICGPVWGTFAVSGSFADPYSAVWFFHVNLPILFKVQTVIKSHSLSKGVSNLSILIFLYFGDFLFKL